MTAGRPPFRITGSLARLRRATDGVVSIETAILMPALLLVVLGGLDVARYIRTSATLDRVAATTADMISRNTVIARGTTIPASQNTTGFYYDMANLIAADLDLRGNGQVTISSVGWWTTDETRPLGQQTVLWQDVSGYDIGEASRVGSPGGRATLPGDVALATRHNAIVVEVFIRFAAWSTVGLFDPVIQRMALFRPRDDNDLRTILPGGG